jgi:hypothetical protein
VSSKGNTSVVTVLAALALAAILAACAAKPPATAPSAPAAASVTTTLSAAATRAAPTRTATSADGTDPLLTAALAHTPGKSAAILGYLLDFAKDDPATGVVLLEIVAMKDGTMMERADGGDPAGSASSRPPMRPGSGSATEQADLVRTLAVASARVRRDAPTFSGVTPQVYGYLVRVMKAQGGHTDLMVSPSASGAPTVTAAGRLRPWSDAAAGGTDELD